MSELHEKRKALEKALEARGWFWEGGTIYAPHKTIWFSELDSWLSDIAEFHQRMTERRDKIIKKRQYHSDQQQHQDSVSDADGLISAIEELIKEKKSVS